MKLGLTLAAALALAAPGSVRAAPPLPPPPACSPAAVESARLALRSARAELQAIAADEDETLVPPPARRAIERVKDRLRAFVGAHMACAPASAEPRALQTAMVSGAGGFVHRVALGPDAPPLPHGDQMLYHVTSVPGHPDMIAVVAILGIRCGSDSMLLLYRRSGAGWAEAMVRRSAAYDKISGGWHDLRFAVSPPDREGKWFVATVSTTPWCTSAWQGLPYELARPGPAPERPNVFFRGRNTIYLGRDEDLVVKAERDAFELRHNGSSLDSDILIRRHVRRYAVSGESVRRVQPVAENVRDFVDEWIEAPWAEAKDWSGNDPALAAAHAGLKAARQETLRGFDSVRGCSGGSTEVQLDDRDGPNWFLLVGGGADGPWTLERAANRPSKGCTGPDGLPR